MSTRGLKKMALLLLVWAAMESCRLNAQTITGNVVTGNLTVTGTNVYMGTQTDTTNPGWGEIYTDGTNSTVEFDATRSGNTWSWLQDNGSILQMTLDNTNTLTLYNQSSPPTAEITLSPTGTSSFASSVTVSGTDNEMPNQTLVNGNSVLTESLGDSRYASSSSLSSLTSNITIGTTSGNSATALGPGSIANSNWAMALGGWSTASGGGSTALGMNSTASGTYSMALGNGQPGGGSIASGNYSTALGMGSSASGNQSTAIGVHATASGNQSTVLGYGSTASGTYSMALAFYSTASGNNSTAMGNNSTASGNNATAMGKWTTASGYYSTASGYLTTAQAYGSFVIGQCNVGGGTTSSWESADPLFEIGNGTTTSSYVYNSNTQFGRYVIIPGTTSDAFVVYKNGNAAVQGSLSAASLSTTSNVTAGGTITAPAVVLTTGSGDIPMFTGTN